MYEINYQRRVYRLVVLISIIIISIIIRLLLYLCSAKAPVLEGSGSRRLYPLKGTRVDRVMSFSVHVSISDFSTIRQKRIRGVGAFSVGNSASLKQRRLQL